MNYFGFSSPTSEETSRMKNDQSELLDSNNLGNEFSSLQPSLTYTLDELKRANVPLKTQISPYLQMDPSIFANSTPQYIMPTGTEEGKAGYEFALNHIGWAIGTAFSVGCARGFAGELLNSDTSRLSGRPWMTRVINGTGKHGSGYAQQVGTAVLIYSVIEVLLKKFRPDDQLNSFAAGALAGGLYRSPHGLRASALGSAIGFGLSAVFNFADPDSRNRLYEMFHLA